MAFEFGPRRGIYLDITDEMKSDSISENDLKQFERFDLVYRTLCSILFNYVPTSGHPGGSISSGRFVSALLFNTMNYDLSSPDRSDADIISYGAGHKALGLYAMWALRNDVARIAEPGLLPDNEKLQLRLEDLLGFRRNPVTKTPLFTKFNSKALDGHPTPMAPFTRLSTGASGVGVAASLGLAFGAKDYYGDKAPRVHIIEGEGGMTPGRVSESFASAGTSCLENVIIHIDWNQSSIDSDRVCRDGKDAGDYVQWNPMEFAYLHDWNVIFVPDGKDFKQIFAAQKKAMEMDNSQPTAIVYRTIKGWRYGIEGRASHGAGHKVCSDGFYKTLEPFNEEFGKLPASKSDDGDCGDDTSLEKSFWNALTVIRETLESESDMTGVIADRLSTSKKNLNALSRKPRNDAPNYDAIFTAIENAGDETPKELKVEVGSSTTLRGELGKSLGYLNRASNGALLGASADLLGSTNANLIGKDFADGFYNASNNTASRTISAGGICEDAMTGILSGVSAYGHHIGIGSSYAAFLSPLGHIASRLHAIGCQAKHTITGDDYKPFILTCAHAGLKTGEDGPTHADPQALQLLQENFPKGTAITLTPWDPQEVWPLLSTALAKRPAVIAPFVTRPNEKVYDRKALNLAPVSDSAKGLYALRKAKNSKNAVVLQGSGVTNAFIADTLPKLDAENVDINIYYVSSAELFDGLPLSEQREIFPEEIAYNAMGITGLTLPTMYRWIGSEMGRTFTMHPFQKNHYLGSGQAALVMEEAGLDGESQFKQIMKFLKEKK